MTDLKRSIWLASTKSIGSYRRFKTYHVLNDIRVELGKYTSFHGISREVLEDRVCLAIKQSLRVRGINWLVKMRKRFVGYENSLTEQIRNLEVDVIRNKQLLQEHWPDMKDPNTSIESVVKYYKLRENYLKAKVKLDCFIEHRKIVSTHLTIKDADDILMEK